MVDISELTESVKGYIEGLQAVLQRKYQISEEKALNMITSSYIYESKKGTAGGIKMKKVTTILILLLISAFMLTGCAKCIDKKEESVKVKIVNEYYKPKETRFIGIINHVPQFRTDYAEYEITVDYNGVEYSLSDESTYRKYHGRIGQTVSAVLITKTYDNGNVKQYINCLGGL